MLCPKYPTFKNLYLCSELFLFSSLKRFCPVYFHGLYSVILRKSVTETTTHHTKHIFLSKDFSTYTVDLFT